MFSVTATAWEKNKKQKKHLEGWFIDELINLDLAGRCKKRDLRIERGDFL